MSVAKVRIYSDEITTAIIRDELYLLYQPQWTADGRTVVSFEALVRWDHPVHGKLAPDAFLEAVEAAGLIPLLTERLMERACREALPWGNLPVAVNVSPAEFANPGLLASIDAVLKKTSFPANRLEIEIVETSVFSDRALAKNMMHKLRSKGVRIALDDFGTGYSSLSLLRSFPIDKVKIDKSFIDDISSVKSASIVHAVIALARAIGLKITAEGVETAQQQMFLKTAGCHYLQGYLLARPLTPDQVADLLPSEVPDRGLLRA